MGVFVLLFIFPLVFLAIFKLNFVLGRKDIKKSFAIYIVPCALWGERETLKSHRFFIKIFPKEEFCFQKQY